jgi:uncharacterized membrane protein
MQSLFQHLPVTPFYGGLRVVKGKVDGFTELIRETTVDEYSYSDGKSEGIIASVFIFDYRPQGWISARIAVCFVSVQSKIHLQEQ